MVIEVTSAGIVHERKEKHVHVIYSRNSFSNKKYKNC